MLLARIADGRTDLVQELVDQGCDAGSRCVAGVDEFRGGGLCSIR